MNLCEIFPADYEKNMQFILTILWPTTYRNRWHVSQTVQKTRRWINKLAKSYLFLCHCLHLLEHLAFFLFACAAAN